ncbi:MAG TPA: hypothetical protein VI076_16710, partial [Actinopolymorphaceae bacterium]
MTTTETPIGDRVPTDEGSPPLPDSMPETPRSPAVWGLLFSSTGLASTVLAGMAIDMLADIWTTDVPWLGPLRSLGWVLPPLFLGLLLLRVLTERAHRARQPHDVAGLVGSPPVLRPRWTPPARELPVGTAELAAWAEDTLRTQGLVVVDHPDPATSTAVAEVVARRVVDPPGTTDDGVEAGGSPHFRAARFDLEPYRDCPSGESDLEQAYAVAGVVLPAFGFRLPDCTEAALENAGKRLVDHLAVDPTLLVFDHVDDIARLGWLLTHRGEGGSPPWFLLTGIDVRPAARENLEPDEHSTRLRGLDDEAKVLVRAMADLPPCRFDASALAAVYAAVAPAATRPLTDVLAELCGEGLVRYSPAGRYWLPQRTREKAPEIVDWTDSGPPTWPASLVTLFDHYAAACDVWTAALTNVDTCSTAVGWFRSEELLLSDLVVSARPDAQQVHLIMDSLMRICDALDLWYARERLPARSARVSRALLDIAVAAGDEVAKVVADTRLRAADRQTNQSEPPEPPEATAPATLRRHPLFSALVARRHHEAGLHHLDRAVRSAPADRTHLDRAEKEFRAAWLALPRSNPSGELAILLDLAVVHLHQGRFEDARERLALAESLTGDGVDLGGRAQVLELQGILAWIMGARSQAVLLWWYALGLFCQVEEAEGESRCLQHLGSVVLDDPALAGLVRDENDPEELDEATAIVHATQWLERSRLLRPD